MGQCLLILGAGALNDFRQRVEYLACDANGFEKVGFTSRVNKLLAAVVPIKVHNGFLEPQ